MKSDGHLKSSRELGEAALRRFKGITHENVVAKYNELADQYEKALDWLDFPDPELCAQKIAELAENPDVLILDAGAGTGYVGEHLASLGFSRVVALDASASMLEIAAKKGVYQSLHEVFLGVPGQFPVEFHQQYDFVAATAVFADGHAEEAALDDVWLALQEGGHAIITIAGDHLHAYQHKLDSMIDNGRFALIERSTYRKFTQLHGLTGSTKPRTAYLYVLRKLVVK